MRRAQNPLILGSFLWSGKRDSNPRPQPWQGCALPAELFPRRVEKIAREATYCQSETGLRPAVQRPKSDVRSPRSQGRSSRLKETRWRELLRTAPIYKLRRQSAIDNLQSTITVAAPPSPAPSPPPRSPAAPSASPPCRGPSARGRSGSARPGRSA
jgi:hypothetical protein